MGDTAESSPLTPGAGAAGPLKEVPTIRISDTFEQPEMATDLMEYNLDKLNLLRQRGRESFASREGELKTFLL
jgi:hypothetical protein